MPKREQDAFTTMMSCYETKKYKEGIQLADSILRKFPNHGETEAMKGLLCNCLERKQEAYELVKSGLKHNIKSHVCWHVYGLIHKSDNNYKEASKCYLQALKIDSENRNILRDLSWLQIQMRDTVGFLATRDKLLAASPNTRQCWVAYGVANYFNGNYSGAFDIIHSFQEGGFDKAETLQ